MKKEAIEQIQKQLLEIANLSEEELDKLSYLMLKEAAGEYTKTRELFFTSDSFKKNLIDFKKNHTKTPNILRNILGVMGFIATQFNDFDSIYYTCLLENIRNTDNKIKMVIARFICKFPQFEDYKNKWEYILSIPKIAPKKHSIDYFFFAIKKRVTKIPDEYKHEIITILSDQMSKINWEDTKKKYEELINDVMSGNE